MQNPYEMFLECRNGWHNLIYPLFDYVVEYNEGKSESEQIVIDEVKEKFGGLKIHMTNPTEELKEMIQKAETESYKICEECGSKRDIGTLYIGGWMYTRCKKCAQSIVNKRYADGKFKTEEGIEFIKPNI